MADTYPPPLDSRPVRSPLRRAVPLILFVVIIGGIAWLVQNMPTWRSPKQQAGAAPKGQQAILEFHFPNRAGQIFWEKPDFSIKDSKEEPPPPYEQEFELGTEGQYLFPIRNNDEQPTQIGLAFKSCDCARLHVALISAEEREKLSKALLDDPGCDPPPEAANWTWQEVERSESHAVTLPAGASAVLRMSWKNRRPSGESLNLNIRLWAAQGAAKKQEYRLIVPAVSTTALRVDKASLDLGQLSQGGDAGKMEGRAKAEFLYWSPTRSNAELKLSDQDAADPLLHVDITPLSAAQCAQLQEKMRREKINTRVRSAWRVIVQLYDHKPGHEEQLGQGHLRRPISLQIPDAPAELPPVLLLAVVRGPVEIGGAEDQGKINLKSFQAKDGTRKTTYLWAADGTTELAVDSWHPAGMKVTLEPSPAKEGGKKKWALKVEVPPNQFFGPIAEDNAVLLRFRTKTAAPRTIRIPLLGHAVQG